MKTILVVLAAQNFRDAEFLVPRDFWLQKGFSVLTTSSTERAVGRFGYEVAIDISLDTATSVDSDAVFFVGGSGCFDFVNDVRARSLAEKHRENNKILAAICAAPRLLLSWGLLKNRKCTGWNADNELPSLAQASDAIFVGGKVVRDGNRITAEGPNAGEALANEVISALLEK